jgi:hypothetical protein
MSTCIYCGGVIGRDCFNTQECGEITRDMELRSRQGESPSGTTSEQVAVAPKGSACESPAPLSSNQQLVTCLREARVRYGGGPYVEIHVDVRDALLALLTAPAPETPERTRKYSGAGHLEETGYIPAGSAAERETPAAHPDTERLNFLESECAELRCIEDRGPDDADLHYEVWKFFMQPPKERAVGMGTGPREAIDAAMKNDDDECCFCGQERNCGICSPVKASASTETRGCLCWPGSGEITPLCPIHGSSAKTP